MASNNTNRVEVGPERETPRGWSYDLRIHPAAGPAYHCTVTLGWADHDHYSGGAWPPSAVVERLVGLLVELRPTLELPERFDAATIRRWIPDIDDRLHAELDTPPSPEPNSEHH